jgi:hypothetical protein
VFLPSRRVGLAGTGLVLAALSSACEPELVVGKVGAEQLPTCTRDAPIFDGNGVRPEDKVVEIGWSTGFEEDGFCDYARAGGYCYVEGASTSFVVVEEPVRVGTSAAAFSLSTSAGAAQTRCFLEGVLPVDAVYGAWFYIPEPVDNTGNWNLMYIQSMVPVNPGLWDVSLGNAEDGSLRLYAFSHMGPPIPEPDPSPPVPIGAWFHVELRLLRATDATGAMALYQDEMLIQEATGIVTVVSDVHQWYVGNLATSLTPPDSTIYVDDVTVRAMP